MNTLYMCMSAHIRRASSVIAPAALAMRCRNLAGPLIALNLAMMNGIPQPNLVGTGFASN